MGCQLEPGLIMDATPDGTEMVWGLTPPRLQESIDAKFIRVSAGRAPNSPFVVGYLSIDNARRVETGELIIQTEDHEQLQTHIPETVQTPTTRTCPVASGAFRRDD